MATERGGLPWLPPVVAFLLGGEFLRVLDRLLAHLHLGPPKESAAGICTTWRRTTLMALAMLGTMLGFTVMMTLGVALDSLLMVSD